MITTEPVFATVKFNSVHKYRSATGIKYLRGIKNILLDQTFPLTSRLFYLFSRKQPEMADISC